MKNIIIAVAFVLAAGFLIWLLFEKGHSADLTRELSRTKQQLTQRDSDLSDLRRNFSSLQDDNSKLNRELNSLKSEAATATRRYNSLQSDREALQRRFTADQTLWQTKEDELNKELGDLKQALAVAEARSNELETEMKNSAVQGEAEELLAAKLEAEEALKARAEAEDRLKRLEANLAAIETGQNEEIQKQTAEYRRQVDELSEKLGLAEERIKALEAELAAMSALKTEAENLRQSSERAMTEAESSKKAAGEARTEAERLKKESEIIREALAEAEGRIKALDRRNIPTVETEYWRREAQAARLSLVESGGKVKNLQKEAAREMEELSAAKEEIERLKDELDKAAGQPRPDQVGLNLEKGQAASRIAAIQRENGLLVDALRSQIDSKDMIITSLRDELSLSFQDRVFFPTGSANISSEGSRMLDKVAKALKDLTGKTIMVIGHTDDQPIAKKYRKVFPSNWELSSARALAVTRYLQDNGGLSPEHLAAVGRSHYCPLVPNDSAENRQKNRRVEIVISHRSKS